MSLPISRLSYVATLLNKDGNPVYVVHPSHQASFQTTNDPGHAKQWPEDAPREEICRWLDKVRANIERYGDIDTLRLVVYETKLSEIAEDDFEWSKAFRMNAVAKLTVQEIEKLGLEKVHIERKMNS